MTKAVMVGSSTAGLASGDEINLFGYTTDTTTEANAQADCMADATFSNLRARIISGGSGTNNFQFRDGGANGNQLASRSGTGDCEDASNTDVLTNGDLFNIAYTDTGTNSDISWVACNIELASGYGSIHGSASYSGVVHDAASSTRFMALAGQMHTDGNATEANVGWKCRGYDRYDGMQVRVTANARVNDATIVNRVASGSSGTGSITVPAGNTSLYVVTGLNDTVADGATVCGAITLGTGVEDLTITFFAALLKSTQTKQDLWTSAATAGVARTASATEHFFVPGGAIITLTDFTEAQARLKPGYAGTASKFRIYVSSNTYTANATVNVNKNGSSAGTVTLTAGGGAGWYENASDTFDFNATDEISLSVVGGTSGDADIRMIGLTLAPTVAGGQPTAKRFGGTKFASIRGNGVW